MYLFVSEFMLLSLLRIFVLSGGQAVLKARHPRTGLTEQTTLTKLHTRLASITVHTIHIVAASLSSTCAWRCFRTVKVLSCAGLHSQPDVSHAYRGCAARLCARGAENSPTWNDERTQVAHIDHVGRSFGGVPALAFGGRRCTLFPEVSGEWP